MAAEGQRRPGGQPTALGIWVPFAGTTSEAENRFYGVAETSDACSAVRVTQALRRCSPLIAPVTLRTLPAPQDGILHEGDFIGSKHKRFGFQDGLSKARKRRCGKDQP